MRMQVAVGLAAVSFLLVDARADGDRERGGDREAPARQMREGDRERPMPLREGDRERPMPLREGDRERPPQMREEDRDRQDGPRPEGDPLRMALRGRPRAEAILDFLKTEYRPELEQLGRLSEERSPEAPEFAGHLVNQAAEMLELRQHRPELFEEQMESRRLDRRSQELAEAYRRATGEERERLGVELKKVLETAFAARLRLQSKQLEAMREELQQQERRLEAREQSRERIVERRFQQLTGQGDDLEW